MTNWDDEQMANAKTIIAIGHQMRMSSRDIVIALMTAMQESSLRNQQTAKDHDSLGLFQQRPSQGWGSVAQVTNTIYATTKFFTTLKGVKGRNGMELWQAAQAVQRSALPHAYADWETDAKRLATGAGVPGQLPFPLSKPASSLSDVGMYAPGKAAGIGGSQMGGVSATSEDTASPAFPGLTAAHGDIAAPQQPQKTYDPELDGGQQPFNNLQAMIGGGTRATIINAALGVLGTQYSWGGGGSKGPSFGTQQGANIYGFDCSGLVQYAFAKAGLPMPRVAADQLATGTKADLSTLQPGDLVGKRDGTHIGIYLGNGEWIEAPHTGDVVKIAKLSDRSDLYGVHMGLGDVTGSNLATTPDAPAGLDSPSGLSPLVNLAGI